MTIQHTPATVGLMHLERLRRMKPSAFPSNIGRGMTVKLDDLNQALREGVIAGAALDVFEQEPLPAEHPLWTAPNVLLTPHVAGYGPYMDARRLALLVDNAQRFVQGTELRTWLISTPGSDIPAERGRGTLGATREGAASSYTGHGRCRLQYTSDPTSTIDRSCTGVPRQTGCNH